MIVQKLTRLKFYKIYTNVGLQKAYKNSCIHFMFRSRLFLFDFMLICFVIRHNFFAYIFQECYIDVADICNGMSPYE